MGFLDRFRRKEQRFDLTKPKWWPIYLNGPKTISGTNVDTENAMRFSTVYACVHAISTNIASFNVDFFEDDSNGRTLLNYNVSNLINVAPNNFETGYTFRENLISSAERTGHGFALIKRDETTNRPTELIRLKTPDVKTFIEDGAKFHKVDGMVERVPYMDMLDLQAFNGSSPIEIHRETIGLGLAQNEFQQRFLGNGTTAVGDELTNCAANVVGVGAVATTSLGEEAVTAGATFAVTGVAGTSVLGSESVTAGAGFAVTGVEATGVAGTGTHAPTFSIGVFPTGVVGTGAVGEEVLYREIIPSQTPNFTDVTVSQTPNFTDVTVSQTPNWTDIAA